MTISKTITRAVAALLYAGTELFSIMILFIIMSFGNTTLGTEYNFLHSQPVYNFATRSGVGILLSAIFAALQALLLIFGKRILGIEKFSYKQLFIYHLLVYSFFAIVFVVIRFYHVLNSDPADRVE